MNHPEPSTHTNSEGAVEEVTRTELELLSPLDAIKLLSRILGLEKQPQQNHSDGALVFSYERSGEFIPLPEVVRAVIDARPDLVRDEAVLERFGVIARAGSR